LISLCIIVIVWRWLRAEISRKYVQIAAEHVTLG
jgi:hypothetical protein